MPFENCPWFYSSCCLKRTLVSLSCLVYFSGSSWAAVLGKRNGLSFPADLYLEGTDQHRGWFQSSLLTSIATNGNEHLNIFSNFKWFFFSWCGTLFHPACIKNLLFLVSKVKIVCALVSWPWLLIPRNFCPMEKLFLMILIYLFLMTYFISDDSGICFSKRRKLWESSLCHLYKFGSDAQSTTKIQHTVKCLNEPKITRLINVIFVRWRHILHNSWSGHDLFLICYWIKIKLL